MRDPSTHPLIAPEPALRALERAALDFAGLLTNLSEPNRPIGSLRWDAGELGRHVLSLMRALPTSFAGGAPAWPDLVDTATHNRRLLEAVTERQPVEIARAIVGEALPAALRGFASLPDPVTWHGGLPIPAGTAIAIFAGDVRLHAIDLARSIGRPAPMTTDDARALQAASTVIMPHFVIRERVRGITARVVLELRKTPDRYLFSIHDETIDAVLLDDSDTPTSDARIRAEPVAFVLTAFGRLPTWRAALTGSVVVSGRKPWLAARLPTMIQTP